MEVNQDIHTFKTITEFNKHYEAIRNDILKRHNVKEGTKVRLKNAIMLYQKFDGKWLRMTSVKTDMIDRIKMSNSNAEFKLKSMV